MQNGLILSHKLDGTVPIRMQKSKHIRLNFTYVGFDAHEDLTVDVVTAKIGSVSDPASIKKILVENNLGRSGQQHITFTKEITEALLVNYPNATINFFTVGTVIDTKPRWLTDLSLAFQARITFDTVKCVSDVGGSSGVSPVATAAGAAAVPSALSTTIADVTGMGREIPAARGTDARDLAQPPIVPASSWWSCCCPWKKVSHDRRIHPMPRTSSLIL